MNYPNNGTGGRNWSEVLAQHYGNLNFNLALGVEVIECNGNNAIRPLNMPLM